MKAKAISKYLRLSTYKAQRILKLIQGKDYLQAKLMLEFMPYKACRPILKILKSAINNLPANDINKKNIMIKEAIANKGPTLKRFQPRAQGRAFPIRKPTCHIKITVEHN